MKPGVSETLNRRICPDALVAVAYVVGFVATVWLLLDAEITMVYAHYQWEIHQETALRLALVAWAPVVLATLGARFALRRFGGGRRQTEPVGDSQKAEQGQAENSPGARSACCPSFGQCDNENMMIRKMTGMFLALAGAVVIWLFPALVTPRHSRPSEGQDPMQYHQAEMAKEERSQRITFWVCVPAGVILGIGLSLVTSGIGKRKQTEPAL